MRRADEGNETDLLSFFADGEGAGEAPTMTDERIREGHSNLESVKIKDFK